MKLTRRSIFPLAAAGIVAADGSQGATLDPQGLPGILVRISRTNAGWCALIHDFDSMNGYWRPGMIAPTKWIPLQEYLAMIDEVYKIDGV